MAQTPKTKDFTMVRGDTFAFQVTISGLSAEVTSIYLTAKKRGADGAAVFQKSLEDGITPAGTNVWNIRVAPEDTADVAAGRYVYDLQIGIGADVYTVLMGTLQLTQDVTGVTE